MMICEEHDSTMCPELIAECPWCRVAQVEATCVRRYAQLEEAKTCQKLAEVQLEVERGEWAKERRGLCRAVTRAQQERRKLYHVKLVNDELRQMLEDKGFNADFLFRAKAAMAKLEAIHELINTMDWEDHGEVLSVVQHIEKALTDES